VAEVQGHQPIVYPVALVAASQKQALAQSWVEFVLSPPAQEILQRFGFGKPYGGVSEIRT
jgi:molybdate transport system substrate-binding protein